jgi:hypothetical protein
MSILKYTKIYNNNLTSLSHNHITSYVTNVQLSNEVRVILFFCCCFGYLKMNLWVCKSHRGYCGDELYENNGTCGSNSVISRGNISSATIILEIINNLPFTSSLLTAEMKEADVILIELIMKHTQCNT